MNNSLMLVANAANEKYDIWTLADAAEYLAKQEKKCRKYKKQAAAIVKSCSDGSIVGGIAWRIVV